MKAKDISNRSEPSALKSFLEGFALVIGWALLIGLLALYEYFKYQGGIRRSGSDWDWRYLLLALGALVIIVLIVWAFNRYVGKTDEQPTDTPSKTLRSRENDDPSSFW
jgi:hypothetical protein